MDKVPHVAPFAVSTKAQLWQKVEELLATIENWRKHIDHLEARLAQKETPVVGNYLQEALEVSGLNSSRGNVYGSAEANFHRIANLWTAQLGISSHELGGKLTRRITVEEVAILMMLVKTARLQVSPTHRDSWVDIAGYTNCMSDVHTSATTPAGAVGGSDAGGERITNFHNVGQDK